MYSNDVQGRMLSAREDDVRKQRADIIRPCTDIRNSPVSTQNLENPQILVS